MALYYFNTVFVLNYSLFALQVHVHLGLRMRKPSILPDTNRPVQSQKQARSFKFRSFEEEGLYNLCSKNKDADQPCSNCTADLQPCFFLCMLFVFLCGSSFFTTIKYNEEI